MKKTNIFYFACGVFFSVIPFDFFGKSEHDTAMLFTILMITLSLFNFLFAFNLIKTNSVTVFSQILIIISLFLVWLTTTLPLDLDDWFLGYAIIVLFVISPVLYIVGVVVMFSSFLKKN